MIDRGRDIGRTSMRTIAGRNATVGAWACMALAAHGLSAGFAPGQPPVGRVADPVPRDVRELYEAGCRYLAREQDPGGGWKDSQQGPGVTGMALMVLLASGEDPNHGAYRTPIRRAVRNIIASQDAASGYYGGAGRGHASMYHHGFAMLAIAEAYGVVDDRTLWADDGGDGKGRTIGESLEAAVKLAVVSAGKNPQGAWRYSPDARDHDTSVSGAIAMGLLGARNAGIEVPDETIDRMIRYFTSMTGKNGQVGYQGPQGGSDATT
ncbi:MAG: squalene--hopene cyclase, partial [Planctomycetia bacterium]|nr:squalene--hopene cyclase [Planctomycetia bacterium]